MDCVPALHPIMHDVEFAGVHCQQCDGFTQRIMPNVEHSVFMDAN